MRKSESLDTNQTLLSSAFAEVIPVHLHAVCGRELTMSAPKSISALLDDALDLIGNEVADQTDKSQEISASKMLLGERNKLKRGLDGEDFVKFETVEKKVKVTPFMDQISSSTVDDPKYWKSGTGNAKMDIKKMKFNVGGTKGSTSQNKAQKKRQQKGSDYSERYNAKQSGVTKKDLLRKALKG